VYSASGDQFEILKAGVRTFSETTGAVSVLWVLEGKCSKMRAADQQILGTAIENLVTWDLCTPAVKLPVSLFLFVYLLLFPSKCHCSAVCNDCQLRSCCVCHRWVI
jgi:hypothetical protein